VQLQMREGCCPVPSQSSTIRLLTLDPWRAIAGLISLLLFTASANASCFESGFKKWLGSKVETVALTRKLPPVIDLAGSRIRITVTRTQSVPNEAVDILTTKLRAELLKDRTRGLSLGDSNPDTELRCKVTSFELAEQHQNRKSGDVNEMYTVLIGNVEASVEVYELKTRRALDSAC
jgi:hypothetical protein